MFLWINYNELCLTDLVCRSLSLSVGQMCPTLSGNLQGSSLEHSEDYGEKNRHKVTLRLKTTEALTEKKTKENTYSLSPIKPWVWLCCFSLRLLSSLVEENKTKHTNTAQSCSAGVLWCGSPLGITVLKHTDLISSSITANGLHIVSSVYLRLLT